MPLLKKKSCVFSYRKYLNAPFKNINPPEKPPLPLKNMTFVKLFRSWGSDYFGDVWGEIEILMGI